MQEQHLSITLPDNDVVRIRDLPLQTVRELLARYQLELVVTAPGETIPGSFWGEPEAGLIHNRLYVTAETPVHSMLHEACHYICMDATRRNALHTNAGGDYDEENGVCYLQILLANALPPLTPARLMADMDRWGYSFRLGSTQAWFERDAEDALHWLQRHGLVNGRAEPTWQLRGATQHSPV